MSWSSTLLIITIVTYLFGIVIGYSMLSNQTFNLTPKPQALEFLIIAKHNILIVFYMSLGIMTIGIVTLSIIFLNGMGIGILVSGLSGTQYFVGSLLSILPHAIIEISAFILAATGDLYIVYAVISWRIKKHTKNGNDRCMLKKGILFNLISIIMLILAAYIEASFSARLSSFFIGSS